MYICTCQTNYLAATARNYRKFAFSKGGVCESTPWLVVRPDSPTLKAFFIVKLTMFQQSDKGDAFCKAVRIIRAISRLDEAFSQAEEVAELSGNKWVKEEFSDNRHDTMNALGLALHTELSTIYEEEEV